MHGPIQSRETVNSYGKYCLACLDWLVYFVLKLVAKSEWANVVQYLFASMTARQPMKAFTNRQIEAPRIFPAPPACQSYLKLQHLLEHLMVIRT